MKVYAKGSLANVVARSARRRLRNITSPILGISSGATRNAIFRAVRKLRSALGPMMEESSEANPG